MQGFVFVCRPAVGTVIRALCLCCMLGTVRGRCRFRYSCTVTVRLRLAREGVSCVGFIRTGCSLKTVRLPRHVVCVASRSSPAEYSRSRRRSSNALPVASAAAPPRSTTLRRCLGVHEMQCITMWPAPLPPRRGGCGCAGRGGASREQPPSAQAALARQVPPRRPSARCGRQSRAASSVQRRSGRRRAPRGVGGCL